MDDSSGRPEGARRGYGMESGALIAKIAQFFYFSNRLRAEKGKEQRAGRPGRTTTSGPPIDVGREGVVAFLAKRLD